MGTEKSDGYFVYKYEHDGVIVYIGKTININNRVKQHKTEPKFKEFVSRHQMRYEDFIIKYYSFDHKFEMDAVENLLINSIKPLLNTKNKTDSESSVNITISLEEYIYDFTSETNDESSHYDCNTTNNKINKRNKTVKDNKYDEDIEYCNNLIKLENWIENLDDNDNRVIVYDYPRNKDGVPINIDSYLERGTFAGYENYIYLGYDINMVILYFEVNKLKYLIPLIYNIIYKIYDKYNFGYKCGSACSDAEAANIWASLYESWEIDSRYFYDDFLESLDEWCIRYADSNEVFNRMISEYITLVEINNNKSLLARILFSLYIRRHLRKSSFEYLIKSYKLDDKTKIIPRGVVANILNNDDTE